MNNILFGYLSVKETLLGEFLMDAYRYTLQFLGWVAFLFTVFKVIQVCYRWRTNDE